MVTIDLGASRRSYEAEGQWTSPVLFTPAEITRFLDATERVVGIAAALLGASSVRLWQDQLLYKPPGGPSETTIGWHQDWASWDTVASHGAFVTAWVAFDDVDEENGAMQMLPASHTWGLVPNGSNFFATDRDAQLDALAAH